MSNGNRFEKYRLGLGEDMSNKVKTPEFELGKSLVSLLVSFVFLALTVFVLVFTVGFLVEVGEVALNLVPNL